ncbi:hypothetical protein SAMN04489812_4306 [Microlunatus soli]|uniref:Polyhydroxyalkanoate synthesis regulator phasin n=2 Tax=Microlunatus soli TaxID=630515 RepID=A0A1H1XYM1_9ACTN|nr:hypothetical protein SAMN04489812_4306 [Microlunatus soli]
MNSDDSPTDRTSTRRTGAGAARPGLPRAAVNAPNLSALAEVFGAAIDGASRMTRERARELAEKMLSQTGLDNIDLSRMDLSKVDPRKVDLGEAASEAGARINQLAEEIMAARKANRELLQRTVAAELDKTLDRSLTRLGLARAEEVTALRDEVAGLRADLAELKINSTRPAAKAPSSTAKKTAAKKTTAKKTATKTTPAKASAVKKTAAKTATGPAGAKKAAKKTAKKAG